MNYVFQLWKLVTLLGSIASHFRIEFIKSLVLAVEPENRLFCDMPLSNDTAQRRIQELCIFVRNEISQCIEKSPFFSLCLDDINYITNTAQIIVCVLYL
jgi:hypothetical protein